MSLSLQCVCVSWCVTTCCDNQLIAWSAHSSCRKAYIQDRRTCCLSSSQQSDCLYEIVCAWVLARWWVSAALFVPTVVLLGLICFGFSAGNISLHFPYRSSEQLSAIQFPSRCSKANKDAAHCGVSYRQSPQCKHIIYYYSASEYLVQ